MNKVWASPTTGFGLKRFCVVQNSSRSSHLCRSDVQKFLHKSLEVPIFKAQTDLTKTHALPFSEWRQLCSA
jgi:hypothetical protein